MSGELTNLIAILGVGLALATFMFAMFRALERRIDETNRRFDDVNRNVARLAEDVAELKGSLTIIRDALGSAWLSRPSSHSASIP